MFQASNQGDISPVPFALPSYRQETLRHILLGDYAALMDAINHLVLLGYCVGGACPEGDRIAWSNPMPTGRSGEYLSIMTRRRGVTTGG
ncbi:MAG: hypothetical protein WBG32_24450 [Nodosilinea sp.]